MCESEELSCPFRVFLQRLTSTEGTIALVVHSGGDPDAVASAFALRALSLALSHDARLELLAPGGLSSEGRRLAVDLHLNFAEREGIEEAALVVLVDTATLEHASLALDDLGREAQVMVIDHHDLSYPDYVKVVVSEKRRSTSELLLTAYRFSQRSIDPLVAWALAIGICWDTNRLALVDNASLVALSSLIREGLEIRDVLSWFRTSVGHDERRARIKAAQRASAITLRGFMVGVSNVGSYAASAASGLLTLGFDLAIVLSTKGKTLRVSVRADPEFCEKTGLSVGRDICEGFCRLNGGRGGGHACVGVIHHELGEEKFQEAFLAYLRQIVPAGRADCAR